MVKDEFGNRRYFGIYRGVVVNNLDPLNRDRLQIKVPQVFSDEVLGWAWPRESSSIKLQVPAVNQGVWVEFEGGDPSFPVWVGTFGKVVDGSTHVVISTPSSIPTPLVSTTSADGHPQLDLVSSLVSLANYVTDLQDRIAALEAYNTLNP
jgi:hypothetical protein